MGSIKQYEVYWVKLGPTVGSEIKKTRPCLVVSPDEMNSYLNTITVAPLTTKFKDYPTRVKTELKGTPSWIVLDQLRSVDRGRLYQRVGTIKNLTIGKVKEVIRAMLVD